MIIQGEERSFSQNCYISRIALRINIVREKIFFFNLKFYSSFFFVEITADPSEGENLGEDIELEIQASPEQVDTVETNDEDEIKDSNDDNDDEVYDESEERLDSENDKEEQHIEVAASRYEVRAPSSMAELVAVELSSDEHEQSAVDGDEAKTSSGVTVIASSEATEDSETGPDIGEPSVTSKKEASSGRTEDKEAKYKLLLKTLR
jgi:hypothetical protein